MHKYYLMPIRMSPLAFFIAGFMLDSTIYMLSDFKKKTIKKNNIVPNHFQTNVRRKTSDKLLFKTTLKMTNKSCCTEAKYKELSRVQAHSESRLNHNRKSSFCHKRSFLFL